MKNLLARVWPWSEIMAVRRQRDLLQWKIAGLIKGIKDEGRHTVIEGPGAMVTQAHVEGNLIALGDRSSFFSCYVEAGHKVLTEVRS